MAAAGAEDDLVVIDGKEAVVGDGDAMGVTAEITQHLLGSAHGLFGVYDPLLAIERSKES